VRARSRSAVHAQRRVRRLRPRLQRVEFGVELVGRAAEHARGLPAAGFGQVRARERELRMRVEPGAVVDAHGIRALVLDERAVHEGAEVAQRGVVQVAGRDPLGDGIGERGGDVVHVGQAVGERDRELAFAGALRHARADRLGKRELAA
jgi:hypothetical protein